MFSLEPVRETTTGLGVAGPARESWWPDMEQSLVQ